MLIDIRLGQQSLRINIELISGVLAIRKIPDLTAIVYMSLSLRSTITPIVLRGSPFPLSTIGIGTATLSPISPAFSVTRLRFTLRSAWLSCASLAAFSALISLPVVSQAVTGCGSESEAEVD